MGWWERLRATARLMRAVWTSGYADEVGALLSVYNGLTPLQRRVVRHVARVTSDAAFQQARESAQLTAVTLGLNKPHTWAELMNTVQSQPVWAENQWRHVHALKLLHKRVTHAHRQMRNPDLNLLTELGYVSFMLQPKD